MHSREGQKAIFVSFVLLFDLSIRLKCINYKVIQEIHLTFISRFLTAGFVEFFIVYHGRAEKPQELCYVFRLPVASC